MLVLTRRENEFIILTDADGKEIGRVGVVLIRGNKVRIGLELPETIHVRREEINRKEKE